MSSFKEPVGAESTHPIHSVLGRAEDSRTRNHDCRPFLSFTLTSPEMARITSTVTSSIK